MSKRNSSIELLKIITLFLLCFSHCLMSTGLTFDVSTNNFTIVLGSLMRCFGQIGNVIFITCSAYFLLDQPSIKKEKIISIIIDAFVISVLFLIVFLLIGINVNMKDIFKSFFPITFQNNWFISCYIMLYIIHPFLNEIIKRSDKKQLLRINVFLIIIYSIIQFILPGKFYFNNLIGFIEIYFITSYVKLHLNNFASNIRINKQLLIISILINAGLLIITNLLGLRINIFSDKVLMWNNNIANPFYIIMAISLFNIFSSKKMYNKTINYLSSCSLLFYMIHENLLFRNYVRPLFFLNVPLEHVLYDCLCVSVIVFFVSMLISCFYKFLIQNFVSKLSFFIRDKLSLIYISLEKILINIK